MKVISEPGETDMNEMQGSYKGAPDGVGYRLMVTPAAPLTVSRGTDWPCIWCLPMIKFKGIMRTTVTSERRPSE